LNTAPSGGFAYFVCTAYKKSTIIYFTTLKRTIQFLIRPSFLEHVNHVSNLKNSVTFSDLRSSPLLCDDSITIKINFMKLGNVFSASAVLMAVLLGSCNKGINEQPSATSEQNSATSQQQKPVKPGPGGTLATVNLRTAGNFEILSTSGITNVTPSAVTGNVGTSPIAGTALLLSCKEVTGIIYTVDGNGPPCDVQDASRLTTAVADMRTAYNDAAGRLNPNFLNLGAGNIGGRTLTAGLYKWTSAVTIPTNITIKGSSTDIFIFQVGGTLSVSSNVIITLSGGVEAKNIFWQTTDAVTIGTTSQFKGNILGKTNIAVQTSASVIGRLLAQTAVTLQKNAVKAN
jgi:hypothetical protein